MTKQEKIAAKVTDIRVELEKRLSYMMEWYKDCILVEETFANIRREANSVLGEVEKKYNLGSLPFAIDLKVVDGYVILKTVSKELN
jgi:hypothetical protein